MYSDRLLLRTWLSIEFRTKYLESGMRQSESSRVSVYKAVMLLTLTFLENKYDIGGVMLGGLRLSTY